MFKTHISTTIPLELATRLQTVQEFEGWKNVSCLLRKLVESYVQNFESEKGSESSEDILKVFESED